MKVTPCFSVIAAFVLPIFLSQCGDGDEEGGGGGEKAEKAEGGGGDDVGNEGDQADDGEVMKTVRAVNKTKVKLMNMNVLKQYAMSAHMASAVEGGLPADLAGVRAAGELGDSVKLTDPNTGEGGIDPIYFSGVSLASGPGSILFACPFANGDGTRMVATADGAVVHLPEAEYEAKAPKEE